MASLLPSMAVKVATKLPRGGHAALRNLASIVGGLKDYPVNSRFGPVHCDLRESVCYPVLTHGYPKHWRRLENFFADLPFAEGATVFDVGANIGLMALAFREKAGTVHCFEPSPRARSMLMRNVAPYDNIKIHPYAVSAQAGTVPFVERPAVNCSGVGQGGVPIESVRLDDMPVMADFIKIDVEGHEVSVLQGASQHLARGVPIMFEALSAIEYMRISDFITSQNGSYTYTPVAESKVNFLATTS